MWWSVFLLVLWLGLVAHELGHYFAFRRLKIPVHEVSLLGLPFGPALTLYTDANGTRWSIRPLVPLGAFVQPDERTWELRKFDPRISTKDLVWISGSGPWASVMFGLVMLVCVAAGRLLFPDVIYPERNLLAITILAVSCVLLIRWAREIALFVFPVLGAVATVFLLFMLITVAYQEGLDGFALSTMVVDINASKAKIDAGAIHAAVSGAIFSIGIGLLNLAWFNGLDGAHLMRVIIWRHCNNPHPWLYILDATIFITLVLVFLPLLAEVYRMLW